VVPFVRFSLLISYTTPLTPFQSSRLRSSTLPVFSHANNVLFISRIVSLSPCIMYHHSHRIPTRHHIYQSPASASAFYLSHHTCVSPFASHLYLTPYLLLSDIDFGILSLSHHPFALHLLFIILRHPFQHSVSSYITLHRTHHLLFSGIRFSILSLLASRLIALIIYYSRASI
jgi:hypothetical protein